jgi:hypothetical protein
VVEVTTVETLEGFLSARYRIELDIDVAFRVGIDGDVDNLAIFLVALDLNFALKVLDPAVSEGFLFPAHS